MKSAFAKIAGWAQFALQLMGQVGQQGVPHGWAQWAVLFGSFATAVGIHHASGTDGAK